MGTNTRPKKCPVCRRVVENPRATYDRPECKKAARRKTIRKSVAKHRRGKVKEQVDPAPPSNVFQLVTPTSPEPEPEQPTIEELTAFGKVTVVAIDRGDAVTVAKAVAIALTARLEASLTTGSESGLAALSRELRENMKIVSGEAGEDATPLGEILGQEHRFGGA